MVDYWVYNFGDGKHSYPLYSIGEAVNTGLYSICDPELKKGKQLKFIGNRQQGENEVRLIGRWKVKAFRAIKR